MTHFDRLYGQVFDCVVRSGKGGDGSAYILTKALLHWNQSPGAVSVKVEVDVLGSPSLIVLMGSCN